MTKLDNQEIEAIANKILRELKEQAEFNKLRFKSEYIPSPNYLKMNSLIETYSKIVKEREQLKKRYECIYDEIKDFCVSLGITLYRIDHELLEDVINKEYGPEYLPDIETLKDDVIIAGMTDSFDVNNFIDDKISEYIK